MNNKPLVIALSLLVSLVLISGACAAGFIAGRALPERPLTAETQLDSPTSDSPARENTQGTPESTTPTQKDIVVEEPTLSKANRQATPDELEELFTAFWQSWEIVHEEYVDQPVDDTALMRGAINGMLDALGDEHSAYFDPDTAKRFTAQLDGLEYEGIGAWVDTTTEFLTVISPMPGSPAEKAGLKTGDQIIAIDGEDMTGVDAQLVRQRVLGPKGTTVILTIRRSGVEQPFDVPVKRASIITPTIEFRMLDGGLAYVHLYTFGSDTSTELRSALKKLLTDNPKGLILDLRYNGGGYLETAIEVVSEFVADGVVMYEEYGDGRRITFNAERGGLATDIPMVVLIDQSSASASEIVAGAIQDRGRGFLVGTTSYGKGSVQNVSQLADDQGQIRVTIARWLTPNGRQINEIGLEPDHVVEITEADNTANRDPQLEKAIELLSKP